MEATTDWRIQEKERLYKREDEAFKQIDKAEAQICEALGIQSLTPMQVLIIRSAIENWEFADRKISEIHDQLHRLG